MINNFDALVARCNNLRRKQMIRRSLFVSGAILLLVALAALYIQWSHFSRLQTPVVKKPITSKNEPIQNAPVPLAAAQPPARAITYSLPSRDTTKARAFVIQLTSSKSYGDVNASRRKIPSQYQPSLAIYAINGFYTLRYIDIYERTSLPHAIEYFKSLGFSSPTAYKYNPERSVISDTNIPKLDATAPFKAPVVNEVPIAVAPPPTSTVIAPSKSYSGNRLFSVQTSTQATTADYVTAYRSNPKFETALIIARDFYAQENFVDAAIWAKKANQLNREAEEAWLLYAKSYYAQGRKSEAINILELYLNYKDSKAASELVRTWKLNSTN